MHASGGALGALRQDEVVDRIHRLERNHAGFLVPNGHPEAPLELEDELEHVDRIESEAFLEKQRRVVANLTRRNRQSETTHDGLLDLGFQYFRILRHSRPTHQLPRCTRTSYKSPPSTPITWPVM